MAKEQLLTLHIQKSSKEEDEDLNLMKFFELLYKIDRRNQQEKNSVYNQFKKEKDRRDRSI